VRICPTNALFKRRDGIVDLNGDSCIGCRACMEACPYDQLFIDPNRYLDRELGKLPGVELVSVGKPDPH